MGCTCSSDAVGSARKTKSHQHGRSNAQTAWDPSWECFPTYTQQDVVRQKNLGAQSLRGRDPSRTVRQECERWAVGEHGVGCFTKMMEREEQYCGDYAVFYHSYSLAALLYEVQTAIAVVKGLLPAGSAPLPRLLEDPFKSTPTVFRLLQKYEQFASARDHHPSFREVAISASLSIFGHATEAPPVQFFKQGYSCGDVQFKEVLQRILTTSGIKSDYATYAAHTLIACAERFGLDVSAFGGKPSPSPLKGHVLQVFVRRFMVNQAAYASRPFGVVEAAHMPFAPFLDGAGPFDGQARVFVHPSFFTTPECARWYGYSADENFDRSKLQMEMQELVNEFFTLDGPCPPLPPIGPSVSGSSSTVLEEGSSTISDGSSGGVGVGGVVEMEGGVGIVGGVEFVCEERESEDITELQLQEQRRQQMSVGSEDLEKLARHVLNNSAVVVTQQEDGTDDGSVLEGMESEDATGDVMEDSEREDAFCDDGILVPSRLPSNSTTRTSFSALSTFVEPIEGTLQDYQINEPVEGFLYAAVGFEKNTKNMHSRPNYEVIERF